LVFGVVHAFVPTPTQKLSSSTSWTTAKLHAAITLQEIQLRLDTYEVAVPKPLGVIFGENSEPYLGLVVDDISEGMNGGKAGLRAGDQLIAVNGKVILGTDFDAAMSRLTDDSTSVLDLVMYRGPVRQM
jgi:S1-C subfamily serine protease